MEVKVTRKISIELNSDDADHLKSVLKKLCTHMGYAKVQIEKEEQKVLEDLNKEL